ncbi:virion structural protein [Pectobacterium phage vB_PcaM_CBB]|uniref:Structural protein n=1 Tax=Pectobacterium phage vB_PcaM_CBB TaxID=2772511 RepID=A0A1L2CUV9_9CAUD|nr:virion structural protein [Pectobacterium phage vB_PcaM_CBB]AMM43796.1 structural protein [Pectobacterium phage vB_PcaM_CBB]
MINYIIKRSNGKIYASVPNNVILGPNQPNSNPVPINLLGRDKVGYGQALNENFLWLAENFAGQNRPLGSVPGQIWYRNTSGTGELLISLVDSARQPDNTNPSTELDWASIPMITLFNTVPDGDTSIMGRMVLTNNGDSLKVLMKNKEWREIQTTRPINKQYESLLDINYDTGVKYISFTQGTPTKTIAYFNLGGASTTDANGWVTFQNGESVLQFGSNYFYELKIMGRQVNLDTSGNVVAFPSVYSTWMIKGSFYVDNAGTIVPGQVTASQIPDPRRIKDLTQIVDTIDSMDQTWAVKVVINDADTTLPSANGTTKTDYNTYVTASLNSPKHLGFRIDASINGLNAGETTRTQWSALLQLTGIPPVGV